MIPLNQIYYYHDQKGPGDQTVNIITKSLFPLSLDICILRRPINWPSIGMSSTFCKFKTVVILLLLPFLITY